MKTDTVTDNIEGWQCHTKIWQIFTIIYKLEEEFLYVTVNCNEWNN
jgi:hypothetical protein